MPEIFIYDEIGPEYYGLVSAKSITDQLGAMAGQPVMVRINSPGGSVVEALAIYNALTRHGGVSVAIDGVAASAASFVAMAGRRIEIAANAQMMIHNAWTVAMGNANDLRKTAGVLDGFDATIAATYAARGKKTQQEIAAALADETWLSAEQAVEWGLADAIGQPMTVAPVVDSTRFAKCPPGFAIGDQELQVIAARHRLARQEQLKIRTRLK